MIAVAAVAWLGLALQCYLAVQARMALGHSLGSALIWFFSFFTVLTNLAIAKSLTLLLSGSHGSLVRWVAKPSTQSGIAAAIALVGITYEILLRRLWKPAGLALVADTTLHDVVPLLYLMYWWFVVPKGGLKWSDVLRWLLYPGIYLLYALGRGLLTGEYPYHFLDMATLGPARTGLSITVLLLAFLLIGTALIALDHWLGKRPSRLSPVGRN